MALIASELRKRGILLKRKPGKTSLGDGVGTQEDLKAASLAFTLFGKHSPPGTPGSTAVTPGASSPGGKYVSKWKKVGLAARASEVLADLDRLRGRMAD